MLPGPAAPRTDKHGQTRTDTDRHACRQGRRGLPRDATPAERGGRDGRKPPGDVAAGRTRGEGDTFYSSSLGTEASSRVIFINRVCPHRRSPTKGDSPKLHCDGQLSAATALLLKRSEGHGEKTRTVRGAVTEVRPLPSRSFRAGSRRIASLSRCSTTRHPRPTPSCL